MITYNIMLPGLGKNKARCLPKLSKALMLGNGEPVTDLMRMYEMSLSSGHKLAKPNKSVNYKLKTF